MPDDAIERARAEALLSKFGDGMPWTRGPGRDTWAAAIEAMLAFAQQAPEGWRLMPVDPTPKIIAAILPKVGNPTDADRDVAAKALIVLGAEFEPIGMTVAADLVRDYRAMLAAVPMPGEERCA